MISVCIPTFNGAKYIEDQIRSILPQLSENDEIIISDNYSNDRSLEILKGIDDKRIKIFLFKPESSLITADILTKVSLNVQNALSKSTGDYIFLSDQDDIWLDGRVNAALPFLENRKPTVVVCNCKVVGENNNTLIESYFSYIKPSSNILRTLYKSSFHWCCMAFNREVVNKAFPFPKYAVGHDLWLGMTGAIYGKVHFLQQPLVLYRRHSSTVTTTGFESKRSVYEKLKYRLFIVFSVLNGIILR